MSILRLAYFLSALATIIFFLIGYNQPNSTFLGWALGALVVTVILRILRFLFMK